MVLLHGIGAKLATYSFTRARQGFFSRQGNMEISFRTIDINVQYAGDECEIQNERYPRIPDENAGFTRFPQDSKRWT